MKLIILFVVVVGEIMAQMELQYFGAIRRASWRVRSALLSR
jgi:hypothetical protein